MERVRMDVRRFQTMGDIGLGRTVKLIHIEHVECIWIYVVYMGPWVSYWETHVGHVAVALPIGTQLDHAIGTTKCHIGSGTTNCHSHVVVALPIGTQCGNWSCGSGTTNMDSIADLWVSLEK